MNKTSRLLLLSLTCLFLGACGKSESPSTTPAEVATEAAKAAASAAPPRLATHDANLQPNNIVWDSAEKQQAWEARNAELPQPAEQAAPQAEEAPAAAPAPAAESAAPAQP